MRCRFFAVLSALATAGALIQGAAPARADQLAADAASVIEMTPFADGLELPTALEFLPDGRLVIAEKGGRLLVRLPSGQRSEAGKLEVDSKTEKGLLNVIRHPAFAENKRLIVYYSAAKAPERDKHRISSIVLGDDNLLDLASEQVLVKDLFGPDDHEQGGGLAIDGSGRLLVGVGDTGCRARKLPEPPYTPTNYFGACLTNGNGKILRVSLDGSIPSDNPLVDVEAVTTCGKQCGDDPFRIAPSAPRKDIWAWGLRNPWRVWVDPRTGSVWTGDVGDMANEEIDVIPKAGGGNYGWPWREGAAGHPVARCNQTLPGGDCVEPAYQCRHDDVPGTADAGCKSINGGLIVDDCRWPDALRGRYFFGDNANGRIWSLEPTPARDGIVPGSRRDVGQTDGFVVDFEVGPDGGLYVAVMRIPPAKGTVLRLAPRTPRICPGVAAEPAPSAKPGPTVPSTAAPKAASRRPWLLGAAALLLLGGAGVVASRRKSS